MSDTMLRTGMFGLNKVQVKETIKTLKEEEARKMVEMEQELSELKKGNQLLLAQLEKLKAEMKTAMKSDELMQYSLNKAEYYAALFEQTAHSEIAEVVTIGQKIEALFDQKINEFDMSIKETQSSLESLLKDVTNKNENIEERLTQFIQVEGAHKFLAPKDTTDLAALAHEEEAPLVVEDAQTSNFSFWDEEDESENNQVKAVIETRNEIKNETETATETETKYEEHKGESNAITREISNIRNKYLIGKVAGSDLKDKSGNVIVAKNQLITVEVVDQAEKEGLLAELVVNMTLPEVAV